MFFHAVILCLSAGMVGKQGGLWRSRTRASHLCYFTREKLLKPMRTKRMKTSVLGTLPLSWICWHKMVQCPYHQLFLRVEYFLKWSVQGMNLLELLHFLIKRIFYDSATNLNDLMRRVFFFLRKHALQTHK